MIIESRMSMAEAGARQDKVLLGIEREIVIMKLIDHPNVLNLYDVWETSSELYVASPRLALLSLIISDICSTLHRR
jgi:serine/threonine-protein kinase HSL1 (negative regulator of Swe1 kinase)